MAKNVVFGRGFPLLRCVFLGKMGEKTKTAVTKIYKKYKYTEKSLRVTNYKIVSKIEYLNRVSSHLSVNNHRKHTKGAHNLLKGHRT
jgi:hypothetical protein